MSKAVSGEVQNALSVIKDPFGYQHIEKIFILAHKGWIDNEWKYSGTVEFENGRTKGEQHFDGKNLASVVKKVDIFIKELEKTNG